MLLVLAGTVYYAPSDRGNCTGSLCLSFYFQERSGIYNLFVNGELDIDKDHGKSPSEKSKATNITGECEVSGTNSHRMDYYNSNQKLKVQDFSSGNPEHKRFAIVCRDGAETCK